MQALFLVFLLLVLGVSAWNLLGPVRLDDIAVDYVGLIREGPLEGYRVAPEGVALIRDWIERDARPTWDPYEIVRHQLRYNAVTSGYDLYIWMEPAAYDSERRSYAIYQLGQRLFLRVEPAGRNRVLETRFTPRELEEALQPFLSKDPM